MMMKNHPQTIIAGPPIESPYCNKIMSEDSTETAVKQNVKFMMVLKPLLNSYL